TMTQPAVTFTGIQMENRVDAAEGLAPMYKYRISSVMSETGGTLSVSYSPKECSRATNMPASPESNTKRCFPQYWLPEGALNPIQDWFHKYVTTQVVAIDNTGGAPFDVTSYEYVGGTAWHYDEEYMVPASRRTWSQWRGYQKVLVTHGDASEQRSQTEYLYLRGMDGDTLPGGATRSVTVADSEGGTVRDSRRLEGFERESIVYNGPGGAQVSGEIDDPWLSAATAEQGSRQAQMMGTASERSRVALATGGWRRTRVDTTFDAFGMPDTENDLGDETTAADDHCTLTTYARNTSAWVLDAVSRTEELSVACTATPSRPAQVISDERSYFDGSTTFGAAPTMGDVTRTEELANWTTGPVYVQTARSVYDVYGRVVESYDALNNKTATAFTPPTGGPVTGTKVTNPLGHVISTVLEPAWGTATATIDANNKRTDFSFDPLGRSTAVWLPGRAKATQSASMQFAYTIPTDATGTVNGPVVVTTRVLRNDGQYNVSYQLFDSLLRARQTQSPAPDGGRLVTDTFYNTRGQVTKVNDEYFNVSAPSTALLAVADNQVPGQTVTTYDGADRVSAEIFRTLAVERWRTTTTYGGDRVNVDPPAGETATTTITDARDQTTELRQYTGGAPSGTFDATRYTYTPDGQLQTITDPAGNVWQRHYDLRGRLIQVVDPDTGTSTRTYDDLDRVTTATDGRGQVLAYAYDALDRQTETHEGSLTGPLVAKQVYDTLANGQLTSSTRYVGTNAYTSAVTGYTDTYQPTGASVTIPAAEGALAGTYTVGSTYNLDGTVNTSTLPAVGGLTAETLSYGYNELGMLTTLSSNLGTYVNTTTWSKLGAVSQRRYGNTGKRIVADFTYEDGTNRLLRAKTDIELAANATQSDINYSYDPAGNITRVADTPPAAAAPSDTQCYGYDYLRRLTDAWTATDNCAAAPSLALLGGPAPYWQSYSYDATGNRKGETQHAAAGDTVRTYAYAPAGQRQPHALTAVTQQSPTGTTTASYGYDASGDTTARPGQTLAWDAEGNLASVSTAAGTTSFLYDATGNRLLRRDPNATTIYIGQTEIKLAKISGLVTATRYYSDGTGTIAVRTFDNRLYWQIDDQNGTAGMSIDAATLAVTRRRTTPFGAARGATVAWKGERGFVDGVMDATTGLTHLGAREYDPSTGRFISADPIIDPDDPQQLNGYAYANNSPVTFSDPDGELVNCGPDGFRCGMDPNTDKNTGHYIGPKPKPKPPVHHTSSAPARRRYYQQPDGGYTPARSTPLAHRHYYQLPDGGYNPSSSAHYKPYHAPQPTPKPSLWQRTRHIVAEVSGVNSVRRCITGHQVGDCVSAAMAIVSYVPVVGTAARVGMIAVRGVEAARAAKAAEAAVMAERVPFTYRGPPLRIPELDKTRIDPWGPEARTGTLTAKVMQPDMEAPTDSAVTIVLKLFLRPSNWTHP
ncbi:MAG TPA: RHS repeat-associated core domain-containing protein, partial [Mycobacterium sp.]|nr:RHS repeat-associated core domain-containing protein [Mycobacterium sp.]